MRNLNCAVLLMLSANTGSASGAPGTQEGRFFLHGGAAVRAADFLKQYPAASAVIEGYTDSDGAAAYNLRLPEARATAVLENLIRDHGIAEDRLAAVGYGESWPVAADDSPGGKQANRRVSVVVSGSRSVVQERDR